MYCVALTLVEHATNRQSCDKKRPVLVSNIAHYVQHVSCSISSAGALCCFLCSVIVCEKYESSASIFKTSFAGTRQSHCDVITACIVN